MANNNPYAGDVQNAEGVYTDPNTGMAVLPPGIGTDAEVNQANTYDREQKWYQDFLKQQGQDPNHVQLSDKQREELMSLIRQQGVEFSDHFEIDKSGNISPISSLGKDIVLGLAIGGAAVTGLGIAGVGPLAGLFGTGSAAADAGVGAAAEAGGGTAGAAGAAGAAEAALTPEEIATGTVAGVSSPADIVGGLGGASAATGGGGVSGALSTAGKVGNALRGIGSGLGAGATAAGNNALDQEKLALQAAGINLQGQNAADQLRLSGMSEYEKELMDRATLEQSQRNQELKDVYRASYAQNPRSSPYNPAGAPRYSQDYLNTLSNLSKQGSSALSKAPTYGATALPTPQQFQPTPYTPLDIKNLRGATGTEPGFMEKYGGAISPFLTAAGAFLPGQQQNPTGGGISDFLNLGKSFGLF